MRRIYAVHLSKELYGNMIEIYNSSLPGAAVQIEGEMVLGDMSNFTITVMADNNLYLEEPQGSWVVVVESLVPPEYLGEISGPGQRTETLFVGRLSKVTEIVQDGAKAKELEFESLESCLKDINNVKLTAGTKGISVNTALVQLTDAVARLKSVWDTGTFDHGPLTCKQTDFGETIVYTPSDLTELSTDNTALETLSGIVDKVGGDLVIKYKSIREDVTLGANYSCELSVEPKGFFTKRVELIYGEEIIDFEKGSTYNSIINKSVVHYKPTETSTTYANQYYEDTTSVAKHTRFVQHLHDDVIRNSTTAKNKAVAIVKGHKDPELEVKIKALDHNDMLRPFVMLAILKPGPKKEILLSCQITKVKFNLFFHKDKELESVITKNKKTLPGERPLPGGIIT